MTTTLEAFYCPLAALKEEEVKVLQGAAVNEEKELKIGELLTTKDRKLQGSTVMKLLIVLDETGLRVTTGPLMVKYPIDTKVTTMAEPILDHACPTRNVPMTGLS